MSATIARRLLLSTLLVAAVALFAAACGGDDEQSGGGGSSGNAAAGAKCGAVTEGDKSLVRHCGDASGEITIDGKKTEFDEGQCQNTNTSIVLNLGANLMSANPTEADYDKYTYMGVLAGKHPAATPDAPAVSKDGTFTEGVLVSAVANGKPIALTTAELRLSDDRSKGEFTGESVNGEKISGSFDCG